MANLEVFLELFKAEIENRGIQELPNALAAQLADFCATQMGAEANADDNPRVDYEEADDYVPIFSSNGTRVSRNAIDNSFETLDVVSGLNVCDCV